MPKKFSNQASQQNPTTLIYMLSISLLAFWLISLLVYYLGECAARECFFLVMFWCGRVEIRPQIREQFASMPSNTAGKR